MTTITSRAIAEMRTAGFKRMSHTVDSLADSADLYGIAEHSNPFLRSPMGRWNAAIGRDNAARMRRAVPLQRAALSADYRASRAERNRINTALHALAYGRRTRVQDIESRVSAVHGALSAALSADPLNLGPQSHSGHALRMVGPYALSLSWYEGALEVAYLA